MALPVVLGAQFVGLGTTMRAIYLDNLAGKNVRH